MYRRPRYSVSTNVVPYVSAYDPANDDRLANLMQQEYQKASAAQAGLAQREGEIGSVMTRDIEGRDQVLQSFKDRVNKIKDLYDEDLALAAPALARVVAQERQNPWYQKNALYNKEYERRQKLIDQFGPNLIPVKDLPTGNLNDVDINDIEYKALNRMHLTDRFNKDFGPLGKQITPIRPRTSKGNKSLLEYGVRIGPTEEEATKLAANNNPYLRKLLTEYDLTEDQLGMLQSEFSTWAKSNLVGGERLSYMQDPSYNPNSTGGSGPSSGSIPTKTIPGSSFPQQGNRTDKPISKIILDYRSGKSESKEEERIAETLLTEREEEFKAVDTALQEVENQLDKVLESKDVDPEVRDQIIKDLYTQSFEDKGRILYPLRRRLKDVLSKYGVAPIPSPSNSSLPLYTAMALSPHLDETTSNYYEKDYQKLEKDYQKLEDKFIDLYKVGKKTKTELESSFNDLNTISATGNYITFDSDKVNMKNLENNTRALFTDEALNSMHFYELDDKQGMKKIDKGNASNNSEDFKTMLEDPESEFKSVQIRPATAAENKPIITIDTNQGTFHVQPNSADARKLFMLFAKKGYNFDIYEQYEAGELMAQLNDNNGKLEYQDIVPGRYSAEDLESAPYIERIKGAGGTDLYAITNPTRPDDPPFIESTLGRALTTFRENFTESGDYSLKEWASYIMSDNQAPSKVKEIAWAILNGQ